MRKRILGRSGLSISELGFGCGGFWGMKIFPSHLAAAVLHAAIDGGINFLDTGPNYSHGHAEIRLGEMLGSIDSTNLVIATKVGTRLLPSGRHVKDFTPRGMEESLTQSLRRLRRNHVDLLQLHSPSISDLSDLTMRALQRFKEAGKVRFLGVSADGAVLKKAIESDYFDSAMVTYNILHRQEPRRLAREAASRRMGVLAKSPLAHGLYENRLNKVLSLGDLWYLLRILKSFRSDVARGRKYRFINQVPGWKGSEIALQYVLNDPNIACAVVGTTKVEHLAECIGATEKVLPPDLLARIDAAGLA